MWTLRILRVHPAVWVWFRSLRPRPIKATDQRALFSSILCSKTSRNRVLNWFSAREKYQNDCVYLNTALSIRIAQCPVKSNQSTTVGVFYAHFRHLGANQALNLGFLVGKSSTYSLLLFLIPIRWFSNQLWCKKNTVLVRGLNRQSIHKSDVELWKWNSWFFVIKSCMMIDFIFFLQNISYEGIPGATTHSEIIVWSL